MLLSLVLFTGMDSSDTVKQNSFVIHLSIPADFFLHSPQTSVGYKRFTNALISSKQETH